MTPETKHILEKYPKNKKEILNSLSITDMGYVVDDGIDIDTRVKKAKKVLDTIKEIVLSYGKSKTQKVVAGSQGIANIGKTSSSSIEPKDLLAFLTKAGKKKMFLDLIKVNVTDAKKYLGEDAIKDILKTETKEYGSVKFTVTKD